MRTLDIDPNKPSQSEIQAHNMKIAKANFACDLARAICGGPSLELFGADQERVVPFCIGVAEGIIERFSLMPDANGTKGGLV